jgi:hypothetical protein
MAEVDENNSSLATLILLYDKEENIGLRFRKIENFVVGCLAICSTLYRRFLHVHYLYHYGPTLFIILSRNKRV